jgi:hypothetical protein
MKRSTINKLGLAAMAAILLGASACTKNFDLYNTDKTGLTDEQLAADFNNLGLFLKSAEESIINFSGGGDPNSYQVQQNLNADCFSGYFMSATPFAVQTNMNYGLVSGWNGEAFKVGYLNIMSPIQRLRNSGIDTAFPAVWAVAQIVRVEAMSRVTDIYGPIPYSQAGASKTGVKYDSQQDVYNRFFLELDSASTSLRTWINSGKTLPFAFSNFDVIYSGNFTEWLKFSNSLRLRLAMHIVKADAAKAQTEGEKALDPAAGGLLSSNSDNMTVKMTSNSLNNPLVQIATNWNDIRINASIISFMKGYNDPRMPIYFLPATDSAALNEYEGIRIGGLATSDQKAFYLGYSNLNASQAGNTTFTYKTPVTLMTAAEVYFLRAEAALRKWANAGTISDMYNTGISTSMTQWNANAGSYADDNTSVPADYVDPKRSSNNINALTNITIKWDDGATDAQKLERIITQKWIAMFPEGQEAWTEFRRTGYPKIFPVATNLSGGTIDTDVQIRRLPFPQNEYTTNGAEVAKAVTLLGGPDNGGTRLWWDKQ